MCACAHGYRVCMCVSMQVYICMCVVRVSASAYMNSYGCKNVSTHALCVHAHKETSLLYSLAHIGLVGLVVKASAWRAEDPEFESRLHRDFSRVESYQQLKNWHSSDYPARRLAL